MTLERNESDVNSLMMAFTRCPTYTNTRLLRARCCRRYFGAHFILMIQFKSECVSFSMHRCRIDNEGAEERSEGYSRFQTHSWVRKEFMKINTNDGILGTFWKSFHCWHIDERCVEKTTCRKKGKQVLQFMSSPWYPESFHCENTEFNCGSVREDSH